MRFAIIDCGTNTFNLLLAETDNTSVTIVHEQKIPVKIGKDGIANGYITDEACRRAIDAVKDYAGQIRQFNPDETFAFATAAFRRAKNGEQLKQEIFQETGISIQTISGQEEARLIAKGVQHGYPGSEPVLVMDIGGGSTEFIIIDNHEILHSWSFEIGASRLLEEFKPADPITEGDIENITGHFKTLLAPVIDAAQQHRITTLVGSSGFFDTLSEMAYYYFSLPENPKIKVYSVVMPAQFEELYQLVLPMPMEERLKVPGLIAFRADMIVVSFLEANFIIGNLPIEKIVTTRYSLKEGILWEKAQL